MSASSDVALSASVILTARRDAGAGLHLITLTPPPELAAGYTAPGQYIHVRLESAGFFVLAGEVGAPSWELLVRNAGEAAAALVTSPVGTQFAVSGPLGAGFPLERANGRALVVAAIGSALAVARPIARSRMARAETSTTHLYLGVRSPSTVPLADEVSGWGRAGVRVVLCLSSDEDASPFSSVEVRRGRVQHIMEEDVRGGRLGHALVFAAGPAPMLEDVRTRLGADGSRPPLLEVVTNV